MGPGLKNRDDEDARDSRSDELNPGQQHANQEFGVPGSHDSVPGGLSDAENSAFDDIANNFNEPVAQQEQGRTRNKPEGREDSSPKADDKGGLYNEDGDKPTGRLARLKSGYNKANDTRNKAKSKIAGLKNKKLLVGVGGGGVGLLFIIIFLLIVIGGNLKVSTLVQNSLSYQFARSTRDFAAGAEEVSSESLATKLMDNKAFNYFKDKYQNVQDKDWGKLEGLRFDKIQNNFVNNSGLKISQTDAGETKLTLFGEDIIKKQVTGKSRFVPGLNKFLTAKYNLEYAQEVLPALNTSMKLDDINILVRGDFFNAFRKEHDIPLSAFVLTDFSDDNPNTSRFKIARELNKAADAESGTPPEALSSSVNDEVKNADSTLTKDVANDKNLEAILNRRGVDPNVSASLQTFFGNSKLKTALGAADPAYAVLVPVCFVFDGSIDHSGGVINNNDNQVMHIASFADSASSQLRYGGANSNLATANGAFSDQLGDISASNIELEANNSPFNTASGSISTEASPIGDYTALDVLGLSSFDGAANTLCPALTNTYGAIAIGAVNIAVGLASLGSSDAAADTLGEGAAQGAKSALNNFANAVADRFLSTTTQKVASKAGEFIGDTTKSAIQIGAATVAAKFIVQGYAGQAHDGLESNADLANEIDDGNNLLAQQTERGVDFGRPMTDTELGQTLKEDQASVAAANSSKSVYERYASLSNANSLLSRMAVAASDNLTPSHVTSLFHIGATITHSFQVLASVFGFGPKLASAATTVSSNNTYYGNIEWGWTAPEENLRKSSASYQPLENQSILDESGNEAAIAAKYKDCYDPSKSMGDLIQKKEIVRTATGDIVADAGEAAAKASDGGDKVGLCSPDNLSYESTDPLAADGDMDTPESHDMIYRWRLAQRYNAALDQLNSEGSVTSGSSRSN